jgi:hypothetical protein
VHAPESSDDSAEDESSSEDDDERAPSRVSVITDMYKMSVLLINRYKTGEEA